MKVIFAALLVTATGGAFLQSAAYATSYRERVLYSFDDMLGGWQPYSGVIMIGERLYGTAYAGGNTDAGTIFKLNLHSGKQEGLVSFDSEDGYPQGKLVEIKHKLFGTASGVNGLGGLVFSFDPKTNAMTPIYGFCSQANCADGAYPSASLTKTKDALYGTTLGGGIAGCVSLGCGTVFSLDLNTHTETVLHSFCSRKNCADGRWPSGALVELNGVLYGTTTNGGVAGCAEDAGCGVMFSINRKTGKEKVLHSFCSQGNCADGANPYSGLTEMNGILYGTAGYGGASDCNGGCGTVFSIDPVTGVEKTVYSFCSQQNCADGAQPHAALTPRNGLLYGTTFDGGGTECGGEGCGTVFSLDPSTGTETVIYTFGDMPDGQLPTDLIDVDGTLYGTTIFGGQSGHGIVFALEPQ